jgi:hypothetical protein
MNPANPHQMDLNNDGNITQKETDAYDDMLKALGAIDANAAIKSQHATTESQEYGRLLDRPQSRSVQRSQAKWRRGKASALKPATDRGMTAENLRRTSTLPCPTMSDRCARCAHSRPARSSRTPMRTSRWRSAVPSPSPRRAARERERRTILRHHYNLAAL